MEASDEVWLQIFAFLSPKEVAQIGRVSRKWYNISRDRSLWEAVHLKFRSVKTLNLLLHPTRSLFFKHIKSLSLKGPERDERRVRRTVRFSTAPRGRVEMGAVHVTPHCLSSLSKLKLLEDVRLSNLILESNNLPASVRKLGLSNVELPFTFFEEVNTKLPGLEELRITRSSLSSNSATFSALLKLPLRKLALVNLPKVSTSDLMKIPVELGRSLVSLEIISSTLNDTLRDQGRNLLPLIAKHCKFLTTLSLGGLEMDLCDLSPLSKSRITTLRITLQGKQRTRAGVAEAEVGGWLDDLGKIASLKTLVFISDIDLPRFVNPFTSALPHIAVSFLRVESR